jgi:membrane protein DedA with SNARE-associated domain
MPGELIFYISKYGYAAILTVIILQEIGMPNPIPVELLVFFTGYLSYKGVLYLPFVILTAIGADLVGASILYLIFYTSGIFLTRKKPKWLPVSEKKINQFREKINKGGWSSIFLFRLVSVTRGYAAVISGLLHINLRIYVPTVIMAAVTWTAFYSILGFILGPSSNKIFSNPEHFKYFLFAILFIVLSISIFVWLRNKHLNKKKETSGF